MEEYPWCENGTLGWLVLREEGRSVEGTINIDGIREDYKMSGSKTTLKLTDVLGDRSVFVKGK